MTVVRLFSALFCSSLLLNLTTPHPTSLQPNSPHLTTSASPVPASLLSFSILPPNISSLPSSLFCFVSRLPLFPFSRPTSSCLVPFVGCLCLGSSPHVCLHGSYTEPILCVGSRFLRVLPRNSALRGHLVRAEQGSVIAFNEMRLLACFFVCLAGFAVANQVIGSPLNSIGSGSASARI